MANKPTQVIQQLEEAIKRSRAIVDAKKKPDKNDLKEDSSAREARAKAEALEEDNEDKRHFRDLREKYATWVYKYLIGYSLVCGLFLILDGWTIKSFDLPDNVLGFLVGSTAVSAIGLVLAVTHGLFKR